MAKKEASPVKNEYYSTLIINKTQRIRLYFVLIVLLGFSASYLYNMLMRELPWTSFIIPSSIVLGIILLLPMTEEWEYKPWQSKPQRYERHHSGK